MDSLGRVVVQDSANDIAIIDLEVLIALPEQLFYNTGIATSVWVVTNRKAAERRRKVQLIDAILSALSERDEQAAICRAIPRPIPSSATPKASRFPPATTPRTRRAFRQVSAPSSTAK